MGVGAFGQWEGQAAASGEWVGGPAMTCRDAASPFPAPPGLAANEPERPSWRILTRLLTQQAVSALASLLLLIHVFIDASVTMCDPFVL